MGWKCRRSELLSKRELRVSCRHRGIIISICVSVSASLTYECRVQILPSLCPALHRWGEHMVPASSCLSRCTSCPCHVLRLFDECTILRRWHRVFQQFIRSRLSSIGFSYATADTKVWEIRGYRPSDPDTGAIIICARNIDSLTYNPFAYLVDGSTPGRFR